MPRRLMVVLGAVLLLGACAGEPRSVSLQAEPSRSEAPTSPPSEPIPTPTSTPRPSSSTITEASPHDPTDTDRARFVADHHPAEATGMQDVAADVDGDAIDELVFAYVESGTRVRVDVAWWTGTDYEVAFSDAGGRASTIDRLGVRDLTGDGHVELVTYQSGSGSTASASLWSVRAARRVERLVAVGGCHDGSHTYGTAGVRIEDRDGDGAAEIEATCDDAPLPVAEWSSDTYVWEDGAYRHAPTLVD